MFKRFLYVLVMILVMIFMPHLQWGVELLKEGRVIVPDKVTGTMVIDGDLSEEAWNQAPLAEEFKTYFPNPGQSMEVKTRIWAAYDKGNLYFAIKCSDPEPDKIKTAIAQRDTIYRDDYVGISLDTLGTRQTSQEFYVNPNGIQMDAVSSAASRFDITPDFVWDSAGKVTGEGYQVELRIPLESIRYQRTKGKSQEVRMGIIFFRSVPRLGISGTWPERPPGQTFFNVMATLVYTGLKKSGLKLEVLPNVTYNRDADRVEADHWDKSTDTNIGVGFKYGITSSITAEGTINPDFSQVESDVFQVEVNQRYPLFYSEKRPFFMEAQEVLDFTIVHEAMASLLEYGMLVSPIHTRLILDPGWAAKVSGSTGKLHFAVLAANDRSAGRPWDIGTNPFEGKSALFGITRAKYNLGADNYLGVLYTGRHFQGERSDVGGMDFSYRFSKHLRVGMSYLHSATGQEEGSPVKQADGWNAIIRYVSPRVIFMTSYERYGTDFYMATAFQNRVGISRFWLGIGPYIHVKIKQIPWLKRIVPYFHYAHLLDLGTKMKDISRVYGLYMNFRPKSELYLEYRVEDEAWKGIPLNKNYFISYGYIQLFKWLFLGLSSYHGEEIFYPGSPPYIGNQRNVDIGLTLEPNSKLKLGLDYSYADFKNKQTREKIYSVNIYNFQTTYQFNKYFFLRGILRYDSLQEKLLTDFLASFTLIPGTVVHFGYGALYLKNRWQNDRWMPGQGELLRMRDGLFFKASYLWRFK